MADCGATGSAIDRSAQILTSALLTGGNGGGGGSSSAAVNEATARASKAIGSFLGNAAVPTSAAAVSMPLPQASILSSGSVHPNNQLGLMNNAPVQQQHHHQQHHQQHQQHHQQHQQHMMHHGNNTSTSTSTSTHPNPLMMQQMHVQQHHHQMRIHANATHMQMQMNMMNQQMAMMQMSQQMQHQQQQQQQQIQQQQHQQQQQQELEQIQQLEQQNSQNVQQQNDINQWHEHLEDEFDSYFKTYTQQNTDDDVTSTTIGHEGHVEGASIEKLAQAWAEAEQEYLDNPTTTVDDDYYDPTNLASNMYSSHGEQQHETVYEFNPLSESYGQIHAQTPQTIATNSTSTTTTTTQPQEYRDLMAEGMKHFNNGNTKEAILCFESQLRNIDSDNSEAWLMLGKCNAENDEDKKAITCLENAVQRDPYSTEALLNLGVSYVNELNYEHALRHLNNWVTHNPNLDVVLDNDIDIDNNNNIDDKMNALDKVKSLLNQAKEYSELNGNQDGTVDILEALGVVYNVSREYDDAVRCFEIASSRRPGDYQLWNKLGATLANNKQSEEAQIAYNKALMIKPKYARAWLNLAISHSNLQNHEEAARCYLQTISLNPGAVHVWSYLRIALTCSEKWDLLPLAASQDLSSFRDHYDFVQY